MNKNKIEYKRVDLTNYKDAIELQKSIFPLEDGSFNILESIDFNLFKEITNIDYDLNLIEYYLMHVNDKIVGMSGLYQLLNFNNELWLGWFGIDKKYRNNGYGEMLLKWTINKAKGMNASVLRLYTDYNDNANAVKLYEKLGFIGEKYTNEPLDYDCRIYSLPLNEKKLELWNNRYASISGYDEFENSLDKEEVLKQYDKYIKRIL